MNEQNEKNTRENDTRQERRRGRGMRGCGKNFPDVINDLKAEADKGKQSAFLQLERLGVKNYKPKKQTDVPVNQVNNIPQASGGRIRKKKSKKYYSSSSSDSDEDYRPRRSNNSALQQLLIANRDKEDKELKKSQLMLNRHMAEEIKAIRGMRGPPPKFTGHGIKKLVGTKRGNRARGDIVAEVMKKEGLSLSQASKYVKEHDLY